jgi:hypothetical protein
MHHRSVVYPGDSLVSGADWSLARGTFLQLLPPVRASVLERVLKLSADAA